MIKAGIVGASGYTGSELVRLLHQHPNVSIEYITSETSAGKPFSSIHAAYAGIMDIQLITLAEAENKEVDVVFLALPHGVSMNAAPLFLNKNQVVIDLSGDFRLKELAVYEKWYQKHEHPELLEEAVYGLPELNREKIKTANLIANPGCYPTSAILALAPIIQSGEFEEGSIIIDSKSGTTGAGIKPSKTTHYPQLYDNFFAYKIDGHRHQPEIHGILENLSKKSFHVRFTPHLLPIDRGILTSAYVQPNNDMSTEKLAKLYAAFYQDEPFVRLPDLPPAVKNVRGSNYIDILPIMDIDNDLIVVFSVIDNLVKGASGQAIQNMNIRFGFPETKGLQSPPLTP